MPFSNILPQTSVILPSGGSQTPGSGTVVFGANAGDGTLPAEIIAAYGSQASAIIWYSSAANSSKILYYYLVYNGNTGYAGGIEIGYLPVGLGTILSIADFLGEFGNGRGNILAVNDITASSIVTDTTGFSGIPAQGDIIGVNEHLSQTLTVVGASILASITATTVAATGAITGLSVGATNGVTGTSVAATGAVTGASVTATGAVAGATVQSTTTQDLVNGTVTTQHHNNGVASYLTDSTTIDTVLTINGSATLGGKTGTYAINYVISYDRVCNVSVKVTWAVATTVAGNQGIAGILPVAARPLITATYQTGLWVNGTNVTGMSQFNYDAVGGIAFIAVPTGTTVLVASASYVVPKPSF